MSKVRTWLLALALAGVGTICQAGTILYPGVGRLDAFLTAYDLQGHVLHEVSRSGPTSCPASLSAS